MKVKELTGWLDGRYPSSAAEHWDNVGLLVGDDEEEVSHVFLALDLTESTLAQAIDAGADMIITHHPMIFEGQKKINNHTFTGRRILSLIKHNIQYYAMHTNYDILGMAELSADYLQLTDREVLSVTAETQDGQEGFGRVGELPRKMSLKECGEFIRNALSLNDVKIYGDPDTQVEKAAICTGSGKSMIPDVLAKLQPVSLTGEKYQKPFLSCSPFLPLLLPLSTEYDVRLLQAGHSIFPVLHDFPFSVNHQIYFHGI